MIQKVLTHQSDLMIVLPEKYNHIFDLSAYDYVPETPNDALQECIQERTRVFNNSSLPLFDNYTRAYNCFISGQSESWNSINNILSRQFIRQVYLEMFIYREKLVRFLADLLNLRVKQERINQVVAMIKAEKEKFSFLNDVLTAMKDTEKNEEYKLFDRIRNDEVHNITRIDRINYELTLPPVVYPRPLGYQQSTQYFFENINKVLLLMLDIKNKIQKIVSDDRMNEINRINRLTQEAENGQDEDGE